MTPPAGRPAPRRRGRTAAATVAGVLLMAAAGVGAWRAAIFAADVVERRSATEVRLALADGFPWTSVATDGLRVALSGTAPDEGARLRAMAAASTAVDASRVVDHIEVARQAPPAPPDFKVELLRNDAGISMIGLVPQESDPAALAQGLRAGRDRPAVADLLQTADFPAPEGWPEALGFALMAVAEVPRAKVSVAPGRVAVTALTDSPDARTRLETRLNRARPEGVTLDLDISAPRPVISPFTLRFVRDAAGARFDACAADTEAARARILAAGEAAGTGGGTDCTLGLGAPTTEWAAAAVPAIAAVAALGAGSVTLSDGDIALRAPAEVPQDVFDEEVARLDAVLPEVFRLTAVREAPAMPEAPATPPADFRASEDSNGHVTLRGRVPDARMRDAVESFARSRFEAVDTALRIDPEVPGGWTVRVIAALEAMAGLASGSVEVTPDLIRLQGVSGSPTASEAAVATLAARLGAGAAYALGTRYEPRLDPALGLPGGEDCVSRANEVMAQSEIGFDPNEATIAGDVAPTLAALGEALAGCGDFRVEVGGHTDSQGSEGFNQRLSQQRAAAVLAALAGGGIATANMTARGYGESRPVGGNETEAGREANRRIEFRLLASEPVGSGRPAAARLVTGVTGGTPQPAAAPRAPAFAGLPFVPLPPAARAPVAGPSAADIAAAPVPVGRMAAAAASGIAPAPRDAPVPNPELGFAAGAPADYTVARPVPRPPR